MKETLSPNTTLSHYRIISKIGAGGMGEVWLAEDTRLDRRVALKLLPAEFTKDADRVQRFIREAKAASALNHPNIITIHEIGEAEGAHYIATEFIDGQTLREQMQRERLSLSSALDLAIQMASALAAAHEVGIIHRDIKPENVMARRDGIVKVLDFGLAKLTERRGDRETGRRGEEEPTLALPADRPGAPVPQRPVNTDPGTVLGTPQYMSPEQARGQKIDARTDLFSLGVVLYEMIAGRPPFAGVNALDVISAILQKEPAPLKQHVAEAPRELEHILSKTLRKGREQRYQTAKDLLIDLKDLKEEWSFTAKLERSGQADSREPVTAQAEIIPSSHLPAAPTTSSAKIILGELKRHKLGVALTLILLLLVAVGGYFAFFGRNHSGPIESLAVLPFINASGNADVEYLSDGMTETLISSLSQLPKLNVKARSSVFRYKGKEFDLPKIAQELKVQAILTGRVVQRGAQLTLSLELVDAQTENAIWSEQYNRRQADLVTLQSEIARDVLSKLKTKLSGADEQKLTKTYTANPEAYQLYLKGRFQWNKRTAASLKQAVESYQQAIAKDPSYALAYAGLAETYGVFQWYSVAASRDSMPQAKAAALRALAIDESLAEGHAALGLYLSAFEWNQSAAEKELRRAIELNPNYATAHQWLADPILRNVKRYDEALAAARRAEELDPLAPIVSANVGMILWHARRYDEAIAQFKHALTLDPNFYFTRCYLAATYHSKKMYAEAIVEFRKAYELIHDPLAKAMLARARAKAGQRGEAVKLLNELKAESSQRYVQSGLVAPVYAALGEKDEAFKWLEKAFAERSFDLQNAVDPILDDLRADPRFADLMRRFALAKKD